VNPSRALLIDDNLQNIEAGKELGLSTIRFQSPEQLWSELRKAQII
jgi:2-haloacid dehalogenase